MRTLLTKIILPTFLTFFVAGIFTAFVPSAMTGMVTVSLLLPFVLLFTWWGALISRWLLRKVKYQFVAYFMANLTMSMFFLSISYLSVLPVSDFNDPLAVIFLALDAVATIVFFLASIYAYQREPNLSGKERIFWIFLKPAMSSTKQVTSSPSTATTPTRGASPQPSSSPQKTFRRVSTNATEPAQQGMPIPPRKTGAAKSGLSVTITDSSSTFLEEAARNAGRTAKPTEPVPFQTYFPTYQDMSPAQQRWYYYWRSQVRDSKYPETDLSYIFIHAYELVNIIGVNSPAAAYYQLNALWKNYRTLHQKLDNYLVDWMADLAIVHNLPYDPLSLYWKASGAGALPLNSEELAIEGWAMAANSDFLQLSPELIYRIAGYHPKQNAFYYSSGNERAELHTKFQTALNVINEHLQRTKGKGIIESKMRSVPLATTRAPFASAIHGYQIERITIGKVRPWLSDANFSSEINTIIRGTENILRRQQRFGSVLRNVAMPPEWKTVIESALLPTRAPTKRIVIDEQEAAALHQNAESIRARLIVTDEPDTPEIRFPKPEHPTISSPAKPEPQTNGNRPQPITIDLAAAAELQKDSESLRARLISASGESADVTDPDPQPDSLDAVVSTHHDPVADTLPAIAEPTTNGTGHKEQLPTSTSAAEPTSNEPPASQANTPWHAFAEALQPHALMVLAGIIENGDDTTQIDQICRSVNLPTSRVIDDINELALDIIGDNIIDASDPIPMLIDEYYDDVVQFLAWANPQSMITR